MHWVNSAVLFPLFPLLQLSALDLGLCPMGSLVFARFTSILFFTSQITCIEEFDLASIDIMSS